jgi:hypothetical protein
MFEFTIILVLPEHARFKVENRSERSQTVHTIPGNLHVLSKLSGFAVNFYAVMQEFFKVSAVEDTIAGRTREIDHEFVFDDGSLSRSGFRLVCRETSIARCKPTEKVTQQSGTRH